jgi:putative component of membrane protein insertase Oxa1/YidC/SpoIIIJ protein YidD
MFLENAPPELILWWIAKGNDLVQDNLKRLHVIYGLHMSVNSDKKQSYMGYLFEQFMKICKFFETIAHTRIDQITISQIETISHSFVPSCKNMHSQIKKALSRYTQRLEKCGPFQDGDIIINNDTIHSFVTFENISNCFNENNTLFLKGLKGLMPEILHNIHIVE